MKKGIEKKKRGIHGRVGKKKNATSLSRTKGDAAEKKENYPRSFRDRTGGIKFTGSFRVGVHR